MAGDAEVVMATPRGDETPGRDRDGQFLPGIPGYTGGRPKREIELRHIETLCAVFPEPVFRKICEVVKEQCLAGDRHALKLLFDRLIPPDWKDRLKDEDRERLKVIEVEYSAEFVKAMENEARRNLRKAIEGGET